MRVEGLASGGIVLDTVKLGIAQEAERLAYYLRAANTPGNLDHVGKPPCTAVWRATPAR